MNKVTKRETPYEGDDIKDFVNANKFHTTQSSAFKDAKYADPIELDPEMSDMKQFCGEMLLIVLPILAVVIYGVILLLRCYP
jgi:hypothetical protein